MNAPESLPGQFFSNEVIENLDNFWMPFTANRQYKAKPKVLVSAEGMYYQSDDGRKILDGTAGLWCCNAGHSRCEITAAVTQQIAQLDYAPTFQLGHPLAFQLAERLSSLAPADLNKVFFTNSGSEAVDTALKIALAYHQANGDHNRTRLIGREKGITVLDLVEFQSVASQIIEKHSFLNYPEWITCGIR